MRYVRARSSLSFLDILVSKLSHISFLPQLCCTEVSCSRFLLSHSFGNMEKNDEMKDFPEATISPTKDVGDVENAGARNHTKRGLSSRQVQFLALGS
mgnify:CR=1 FL=1